MPMPRIHLENQSPTIRLLNFSPAFHSSVLYTITFHDPRNVNIVHTLRAFETVVLKMLEWVGQKYPPEYTFYINEDAIISDIHVHPNKVKDK